MDLWLGRDLEYRRAERALFAKGEAEEQEVRNWVELLDSLDRLAYIATVRRQGDVRNKLQYWYSCIACVL